MFVCYFVQLRIANRNGLKFFTREGGLEGSDIEEILEYAQNGESPAENSCGKIRKVDYMTDYAKGLCKKIKEEVNAEDYEHPLKGFKIVVDAGGVVYLGCWVWLTLAIRIVMLPVLRSVTYC